MNIDFRISIKRRNSNLYISPEGDFDGNSAWQLVNCLHEQFTGRGRIYIDTNGLEEIYVFGIRTFQHRLDKKRIPVDRITFMGEKAFRIAPEGYRIVPIPEHHTTCRCNGKCKVCKCAGEERAGLIGI